jgi:hypothetical protein
MSPKPLLLIHGGWQQSLENLCNHLYDLFTRQKGISDCYHVSLCREWFHFLFLAPDIILEKLDHLYFSWPSLYIFPQPKTRKRLIRLVANLMTRKPRRNRLQNHVAKKGGRKGLECRRLARKRLILLSSANLTSRKQWQRVPRQLLAMRRRAPMENLLLRFWLDLSVWDLD